MDGIEPLLLQTDVWRTNGAQTPRWLRWAEADRPAVLFGLLAVFVALWFAYEAIPGTAKALHNDMTEAYVWGREFQLGYNQHPPFWAWVAGLWFMVFPRTNWPFILLALLNSAVGLAGAWRLVGLFAGGWTRRAAVLLLLCTPFYTFKSYNFNANSIFLSLWPWTCYFFLRSMDTRRRGAAVLFGAMVGLCLLSKYYAIVLILTCAGASFAHPGWRAYYRSASPWISCGVAAAMFLPHLAWAVLSGAPPVDYALGITGLGLVPMLGNSVSFLLEVAAFNLGVVAVVVLSRRRAEAGARADLRQPDRAGVLAALVFLPVGITVLFGLALQLQVAGKMVIGVCPLLPLWLLLSVPTVRPRVACAIAAAAVLASSVIALAASPFIARYTFRVSNNEAWALPQRELAVAATRLWRQETGIPLRLVGGSKFIGNAVAFYSADRPAGFIFLSQRQSPWVTDAALARDGLLAVCLPGDQACTDAATRLMSASSRRTALTLAHTDGDQARAPVTIDVFVIPPGKGP